MFRAFRKIFAVTALALVFALVAFSAGSGSRTTEAVITSVTLITPGFANCGTATSISATVFDNAQPGGFAALGTLVSFSSGQGSFSPNPTFVGAGGTATTAFTPFVSTGSATISASAGGVSSLAATLTILCGTTAGFNPAFSGACPIGTASSPVFTQFGTTSSPFFNPFGTSLSPFFNPFGTTFNPLFPSTSFGGVFPAGCVPTAAAVILPVVPSSISILAPSSASCGGAVSITATVRDSFGLAVPNGTTANFSTNLGQISATDQTSGGVAVSSLTIPTRTSGTAQVIVTSGGASGTASIPVSCVTAAAPVAVAPAPVVVAPAPAVAAVRPPSTGDGGLLIDAE